MKVKNYTTDANDEKRDAFYATRKELKVNGTLTETIKLYRPFAQVNFATADYADAKKAGFNPAVSSFTASEAATTFDTFAEEGKDKVEVALTETEIPADVLKTLDGVTYTRLAMNYLIPVGKQGESHNIDVAATFKANNGEAVTVSAPNAPVQNNYRTNILGNLLTSQVIFNVEIVPIFNEPDNDIDIVNVKDEASLRALFATGGEAKLAADVDITVSKSISLGEGKEVTLDLNGHKISNSVDLWKDSEPAQVCVVSVDGGTLTIKGEGGVAAKANDCYTFNVKNGGKLVIEGGEYVGNISVIQVQEGLVEISGGKFSLIQTWPSVGNGYDYTINLIDAAGKDGTANAIVTGGCFYKFDPSDNNSENPKKNYVADGYKSTLVGDYYVVTKEGVTPVADQEGMNTAISGEGTSKDKPITVELPSNTTVTLDNGIANEGDKSRNITFVGDGTQTFDVITKAINAEGGMLNYQRGSSFIFKNLTIKAGEGDFDGIVCDELTFENCTLTGSRSLYGKATFVNCVFENTMANQYSIRTWGGTDVKFDKCTFNTNGKAILLYGRATEAKPTNLIVTNCTLNDRKNGAAGKAAIEIGNDYNATYSLTIANCTVNGFAEGKNTGSKLWANKNSMDAGHLSVTIDGSKVQ
ncbi:MAG: hypothetical protein UDS46_05925 [Bacteroidales bacterium]|nr:hypothetical protein [Bacteroidales bacterium]